MKKEKDTDTKAQEKEVNHNNYIKNKVSRDTKTFIKAVKAFLIEKSGGDDLPAEWSLSLDMLEVYYKQFLEISLRLDELPMVTEGRYGPMPNPLLAVRDKAATRLESLMAKMGLTLKASKDLGAKQIHKAKNPLEAFMAAKMKKEGIETS